MVVASFGFRFLLAERHVTTLDWLPNRPVLLFLSLAALLLAALILAAPDMFPRPGWPASLQQAVEVVAAVLPAAALFATCAHVAGWAHLASAVNPPPVGTEVVYQVLFWVGGLCLALIVTSLWLRGVLEGIPQELRVFLGLLLAVSSIVIVTA